MFDYKHVRAWQQNGNRYWKNHGSGTAAHYTRNNTNKGIIECDSWYSWCVTVLQCLLTKQKHIVHCKGINAVMNTTIKCRLENWDFIDWYVNIERMRVCRSGSGYFLFTLMNIYRKSIWVLHFLCFQQLKINKFLIETRYINGHFPLVLLCWSWATETRTRCAFVIRRIALRVTLLELQWGSQFYKEKENNSLDNFFIFKSFEFYFYL